MSEKIKPRNEAEILAAVRHEQNEIEESLREDFLNTHLFHDAHFATTDFKELLDLRHDFMNDKAINNMDQRFNMALTRYFDKIHVVELGMAVAPFETGCVDSLVDEYRSLRASLIEKGFVKKEASRQESGRNLEVRLPTSADLRNRRVVVVRNRPLISSTIPEINASIGIAKRMVFSIPTDKYVELAIASGGARQDTDGLFMAGIEDLIDRGDPSVDPIRIGYYLSTSRIE